MLSYPAMSTSQLELWVQGFPRGEAEERLAALEAEAATIRNALALADSLVPASLNGSGHDTGASDAPPNRPASIRRILRDANNTPTPATNTQPVQPPPNESEQGEWERFKRLAEQLIHSQNRSATRTAGDRASGEGSRWLSNELDVGSTPSR